MIGLVIKPTNGLSIGDKIEVLSYKCRFSMKNGIYKEVRYRDGNEVRTTDNSKVHLIKRR